MRSFVLISLALAGCAAPAGPAELEDWPNARPVMESYAARVDASFDAWAETYGEPEDCDPAKVRVLAAALPVLQELCRADSPNLLGCHVMGEQGRDLLLTLEAPPGGRGAIVTHEAMHWLALCAGDHPHRDPFHTDAAIWGAGGILERALSRGAE